LNSLERKAFYSFLLIYLGSSLLFVLLSGYWYYSAQKNALNNETYYRLEHFADKLSGLIIDAQMSGNALVLPDGKNIEYELIKTDEAGREEGYFEEGEYKVLISSAPREHLNVKLVIVKTKEYAQKLQELQKYILSIMALSFMAIIFIAVLLGRLFMSPIHRRVEQIEQFVQDVTHELNTPITALKMSTSRAIKKEVYDKKILTNISISTKQLESIYSSLTYLNFDDKQEESEVLDLALVIQKVVDYYSELSSAKKIEVETNLSSFEFTMVASRAELLISNLLSNAIKYSMPETTIKITLEDKLLTIEDEGMGIAQEKLDTIFELYERDSTLSGGFGVGLSIVKQICDEYGIKVSVDSLGLEVGFSKTVVKDQMIQHILKSI